MSQSFKRGILANYFSFGFMAAVGLLQNYLIAKYHNPSVLGVFNQALALFIVSSQIGSMGLQLSVLKRTTEFREKLSVATEGLMGSLLLGVFTSALTCGVLFAIRDSLALSMESSGLADSIDALLLGLFFFSINKILMSFVNGLSRMVAFAVFQMIRAALLLFGLVALLNFNYPGNELSLIFTISELGLFGSLLTYVLWVTRGYWQFRVRLEWIRRHFQFGLRGMWGNALLELNTRVDILVLGLFEADKIVGIYGIAAMIAEGYAQLAVVIRNNLNPKITESFHKDTKEDLERLLRKFVRSSYFYLLIPGLLGIGLYGFAIDLVQLESIYKQGWIPFAVLMAGYILFSGYLPLQMVFNQLGAPGLHSLLIALGVGMNILLNFALVPHYSMLGAAIATSLAHVLQIFVIKLFAKRHFELRI